MVMLHIKFKRITIAATRYQIFCMCASLSPTDPGDWVNRSNSTFSNMVMLYIRLKGITNAAAWYQVFCQHTPPPPTLRMGSMGQNSTFLEHGHVAYQIEGNHECSNIIANILPADAQPHPGDEVNKSKFNFSEHVHVAYQIKWNNEL